MACNSLLLFWIIKNFLKRKVSLWNHAGSYRQIQSAEFQFTMVTNFDGAWTPATFPIVEGVMTIQTVFKVEFPFF